MPGQIFEKQSISISKWLEFVAHGVSVAMSSEEGWAQLVSTTDSISEPVVVKKNKFIFGRARTADLVFEGNKLVSGCHCVIEKDAEGKVWLQDTSTNGTLVNLSKKVHKMKMELHHGDEIHLVYRKVDPTLNIAYVYQNLASMAQEELDTTIEASSEDTSTEDVTPFQILTRRKTFEGPSSDDEAEVKQAKMLNVKSQGFVPKASASRTSAASPGVSDETQPPPGVSDETQPPPGVSDETQPPPGVSDETQAPPGVSDETQAPPGVSDETQPPPGVSDETQPPPGVSDETQPPPGVSDETQPPPGVSDETQPPPGVSDETQPPPGVSDETQAPPGVSDETQPPPGVSDETQPPPGVSDETQAPPGVSDATPSTHNPRITRAKRGRSTTPNGPTTSNKSGPRPKMRRLTHQSQSSKSSATEDATTDQGSSVSTNHLEKGATCSTKTDVPEMDPYEETLICMICQEIMHNVVSVQPCMHSFCAGCYSGWMIRSNECPSCRAKVRRIHKNHLVNNLVEVYLKQKPEKKRSDSDLKEMEAKTTIKNDMSFPKDRGSFDPSEEESGPFDDDDDDDDLDGDYHSSDEDEDDNNDGGIVLNPNGGGCCAARFNAAPQFGGFGHIRPPPSVCRQCPTYVGQANNPFAGAFARIGNVVNNFVGRITAATGNPMDPAAGTAAAAAATATDAAPGPSDGATRASLPDQKTFPTAPAFACLPGQVHIMCSCCLQPMPDRRNEYTLRPDQARPQQCRLCFRMFCHAYWGCNNANCLGCIGKFQEMNFGRQCLDSLILENQHESALFMQYLNDKGISVRDLLAICCDKLRNGTYKNLVFQDPDFIVCYTCGLHQFRDFAYQYRKDIPMDQMPVAARGRPDCYWGRNCRTQKGRIPHAMRYNHICEQTRIT